ncbi:MAG TPA: carboxymethylenebutenolidase [Rhodospirillaceae bacterium]|nr:carboxymethylenebutenolidase [Rhodospirillaceae bacterium]|tara:strand:- start:192 stop:869 length:678 start_codon:yes stop_codon:yes gene_type:complete
MGSFFMAERISVTAADGHTFDAWHTNPTRTAKGGVIFLQAIYGLTDHLGDVCDWFAGDGFAAVAPAIYDRTERNKVFTYDDHGGMQFRENLKEDTVLLDIGACATLLRQNTDKIAIAGFCTGGTWAWIAADRLDMDAAVIFYGSDIHDNLGRQPKCPAILHYGDTDHVVAFEQVQKIQTTYPDNDFYVYPGAGHAFYNPEQAHHDPEAAKLAHQRSVKFLEKHFA